MAGETEYLKYLESLTPEKSREGVVLKKRLEEKRRRTLEGRRRMRDLLKKIASREDQLNELLGTQEFETARSPHGGATRHMPRKNPQYKKPKYGQSMRKSEHLQGY